MGYPAYPTMKLYITRGHFILQTPDLGSSYQLIIERESGRTYSSEKFNPLEHGALKTEIYYLDIFLIIGIVPVNEILYLAVVTEADIIDSIKDQNIYTIKGTRFIPISLEMRESESERVETQNLIKLLSTGFYFSYYYDLTRALSSHKVEGSLHDRADTSFYWNYELCRDFVSQAIDTQWFFPIIQGYVGIQTIVHENSTMFFALISRRSCERTGTRYNCRGLDDEGNVANYVETEQILIIDDLAFSCVQVRGSVPLFWEQTGMSAQVSITRSREMNEIGLKKHGEEMCKRFGKVTMVNLLSSSKSGEKELTDAWEGLNHDLSQVFENRIYYQHYDFHGMVKGSRFSNINAFIYSCLEDYINFFYFYMEKGVKKIYHQKGIIRTNCLDCLDRTNVMQSYIGWIVLYLQMQELKLPLAKTMDGAAHLHICRAFKNMWADNGDALSEQYTGTGSTISNVTREGKRGLKGMISHGLKTLNRFYNANVEDANRQKGIDFLLRKRGDAKLLGADEKLLNNRKREFTEYSKLRVRAVTWNLAGRKIPESSDFYDIIIGPEPPDLLFVTFEECVKLNPRNVLQEGNNREAVQNLRNIIERSLFNTGFGYSKLCQNDLVGICMFIYAKRTRCDQITKLETDAIRVGFGGKMGNKGGVAGRLNINDTSICVLGCHLESGNENNDARISQLLDMHNRAFQQEKVGKTNQFHMMQHNIRFVMGDLNFRVPLPNHQVRAKIANGQFKDLIRDDQLVLAMQSKKIPEYREHEINFIPTYKFDFGTDIYDTSKKQRSPAWCDRILFCGEGVRCLDYGSVDNKISDHRPVFGDFLIEVEKIDHDMKRKIEDDIILSVHDDRPSVINERKSAPEFVDLLG